MSRLRATTPVEVDLGPCECPGTPHADGDKAWLRPRIRPDSAYAATVVMTSGGTESEIARGLAPIFIGETVRWNLLDDAGKPIPCTVEVMMSGRLDWETTIKPIADEAADLYTEEVMRPLVTALGRSWPDGQMLVSTSATQPSTSESPTLPEPSTTTTSPVNPSPGEHTSPAFNS